MRYKIATPQEMGARIRSQYPATHPLSLRFGDCRIGVQANDKAISDALSEYFGPFLDPEPEKGPEKREDIQITVHEAPTPEFPAEFTIKQPDPGKTKIKEEFLDLPGRGRIVRKRLTGMVFIFGPSVHAAIGPCLENLNQVVNFVNNRFIQWKLCRGALLGHAAGVMVNGKGLGLAGFSGAGKSTLALQLMNKGALFVSNDRLMVQKNGNGLSMYGVAKMPRINPGTALNNPNLTGIMTEEERRRFSEMPKEKLWDVEHKYDAIIDECFGKGRFLLDGPMDGLVILNWSRYNGSAVLQEVNLNERRDLLPAFIKSTGLFFIPNEDCRMPEPNEGNYIDFLSGCRVFEVTGSVDFQKAARECIRCLSE